MKYAMKHKIASALLGSVLFSAALPANTIDFVGNTSGGPSFNRPTESGARSFFSVPFLACQFNVSTSGTFTFALNAANPANRICGVAKVTRFYE